MKARKPTPRKLLVRLLRDRYVAGTLDEVLFPDEPDLRRLLRALRR